MTLALAELLLHLTPSFNRSFLPSWNCLSIIPTQLTTPVHPLPIPHLWFNHQPSALFPRQRQSADRLHAGTDDTIKRPPVLQSPLFYYHTRVHARTHIHTLILRSASFRRQAVIMTLARLSSDSSWSSLSLPGWHSAFKCSMAANEDGHLSHNPTPPTPPHPMDTCE